MPTYTVTTYRCPKCRADVGRRFGLYTRLMIDCPNCGAPIRLGRDVIGQNWGFNFAWAGGLVLWLFLAAGSLLDPRFAAMIGRQAFPADTMEQRLLIAGVSVLPAFLAGLLVGGVGWLLGLIVAGEAPAPRGEADGFPARQPSNAGLWTPGGYSTPPEPAAPRRRSVLVRAFFVLLWSVVFFLGAALVLGVVATAGMQPQERGPADVAGTIGLLGSPLGQGPLAAAAALAAPEAGQERQKQRAAEKLGKQSAPWLVLGTLAVFVVGCAGWLPSTGRGVRRQPAAPPQESGAPTLNLSAKWGYDFRQQPPVYAPEPPRRNALVRILFVLAWPAAFFVAAGLTAGALAGGFSTDNQDLQKSIFRHSAEANVSWILLGSLLLFILGCAGLLPWTGAKERTRPASDFRG